VYRGEVLLEGRRWVVSNSPRLVGLIDIEHTNAAEKNLLVSSTKQQGPTMRSSRMSTSSLPRCQQTRTVRAAMEASVRRNNEVDA
jgi:hypothetical protein